MQRGLGYALALAIGGLAVAVAFLAGAILLSSRPSSVASPTPVDLAAACAAGGTQPGFALYRVQQQSMEPLLDPADILLVETHLGAPVRGEIVVFRPPAAWAPGDGTPFAKRVIGLPGETVEIRDGRANVGGIALAEPYLYGGDVTRPTGDKTSWQVPQDQIFVMGDHRANSADSRVFGPVPLASIVGRAVYRCAPSAREGPIQ